MCGPCAFGVIRGEEFYPEFCDKAAVLMVRWPRIIRCSTAINGPPGRSECSFFAAGSMPITSRPVRTSSASGAGQALGGSQQQAVAVGNLTADVVRKAAIGEGDVATLLENHDLGRLVEPSYARPGRRARCYSPTITTFIADLLRRHSATSRTRAEVIRSPPNWLTLGSVPNWR